MHILSRTFLLFTLVLFLTGEVRARIQWYGDPKDGRAAFDALNFEGAKVHTPGKGSLTSGRDPEFGKIWKLHKPASDKRAEVRGAKGWSTHKGVKGNMKEGETYYIGWRYKFEIDAKQIPGFACFQWQSYEVPGQAGEYTQNYPFNMGYNGKELSLTAHDAFWEKDRKNRIKKLWTGPLKTGEWADVMLVVKVSRDPKIGFIEIYYNGALQKLSTGGTRIYHKTMDGTEVAPKWGAYNSASVGTDITVCLADMRIGTDLKSVMPKRK